MNRTCIKEAKTVGEWADKNIPETYYNWYVGYGDDKRTDVEEWYEEITIDGGICPCAKCSPEQE
jgi:hypothetical protein